MRRAALLAILLMLMYLIERGVPYKRAIPCGALEKPCLVGQRGHTADGTIYECVGWNQFYPNKAAKVLEAK